MKTNRDELEKELQTREKMFSEAWVARWEQAAKALGEIGDERSIPMLIEAILCDFKNPKLIEKNQRNLIEALTKIIGRNTASDLLIKELNGMTTKSREAASALRVIGGKRAIDGLALYIKKAEGNDNNSGWPGALRAIGEIGGAHAIAALESLLNEGDLLSNPKTYVTSAVEKMKKGS